MKRLFQLVRCEFIKDFSVVRLALCGVILFLIGWFMLNFVNSIYLSYHDTPSHFYRENVDYIISERDQALLEVEDNPSFYHKLKADVYSELVPYYEAALNCSFTPIEMYLRLLTSIYTREYVLSSFIEHNGTDFAKELILDDDPEFNDSTSYDAVVQYSSFSLEMLKEELEYQQKLSSSLEQAILDDAYYHIAEYWMLSYQYNSDQYQNPCLEYVIQNQITDQNDVRIHNQCFYYELEDKKEKFAVPLLEDFLEAEPYQYSGLETYDQVVRYYTSMNEKIEKEEEIVKYAIDKNIPHNIVDVGLDYQYVKPTSQTYMDYGLYLSFAVIILISICFAGIVSNEHKTGTVKLLYTRKATRVEVLSAKFIYVVINLFLYWMIASVIFFFLVGYRYGFADLFGSKIIMLFGHVTTVPYLLWYFVSMVICMLPMLFYVSLLFLCSAFIPTQAVTSTLLTVLSVFFSLVWILIAVLRLLDINTLVYLPLAYGNYAFSYLYDFFYQYALAKSGVPNAPYGMIVSLIGTFVVFGLVLLLYRKKDIKN